MNISRGSFLLFLLLLSAIGVGAAGAADAQVKAKGAVFGDKTIFQSADIDYALSSDKKAFTITFANAVEASVGSAPAGAPNPPIASQAFSVVIPVSGQSIDTSFILSAFALIEQGAEATLMFVVNDKSTVMHFPGGTNRELLVPLHYRAKGVSDVRLTIFVLAASDQAHAGAGADLRVVTIDTDILVAQQRLNDKQKKKQ